MLNIIKINLLSTPKHILEGTRTDVVQKCGIKYFKPPPTYDHVEFPERVKPGIIPKVPTYAPGVKPPKMTKHIDWMRGPELVHNTFIYKQYGIVAQHGGRMRSAHFEAVRNELLRLLDYKRMFAVWRIEAPWQSCTKKPIGQTLGGGKGSIHHYVTPIKAERVIVEVGGYCEFKEVDYILEKVAKKLPFRSLVTSHEQMQEMKKDEKWKKENNLNRYNMEYVIKNNMGDCHRWVKDIELEYFGKYD